MCTGFNINCLTYNIKLIHINNIHIHTKIVVTNPTHQVWPRNNVQCHYTLLLGHTWCVEVITHY